MDFSVCQSAEQIILSPRLGKLITLQSRNYFGLFPQIKSFKSAILYKGINSNYFEVTTDNSTEKIPVSDSTIIAMAFVIDRFEDIITNPSVYNMNKDLIKGLIRVNTYNNNYSKKVEIVLKDQSKAKGYIIHVDSTFIVLTKSQDYDYKENKFRIIHYSDIYSIQSNKYLIIYYSREIFEEYAYALYDLKLFTNSFYKKATPPEVLEFVKENANQTLLNVPNTVIDFDNIYMRKASLSTDVSYQIFNVSKMIVLPLNMLPQSEYKFSFDDYYSFGLNFDYNITPAIRTQIGYNYETIDFNFKDKSYDRQIKGQTINFNVFYNLWHSKRFRFQELQSFFYVFAGAQMHWYTYYAPYDYIYPPTLFQHLSDPGLEEFDICKEMRMSYKAGISYRLKTAYSNYCFISLFTNYHRNYGLINYDNELYTRNIDYIFSYGFTFGIGLELEQTIK
jgi:hypothetical protein